MNLLPRCFKPGMRRPFFSEQRHAGQAMVEFALMVLFAFLPMTFGLIEIGRGVWYYNQLSQLSREAARWIVVLDAKDRVDGTTTFFAMGNSPTGNDLYSPISSCGTCGSTTAVGWVRGQDVGIPNELLQMRVRRARSGDLAVAPWYTGSSWPRSDYFVHGQPIFVELSYPYQPIIANILNIPATITMRASTVMELE